MNRTRRSVALVGWVMVLLGATATAAHAAPAEVKPPVGQCVGYSTDFAATCFQWVGDDQWIEDRDPNGWAAVVHVQTNYGKDRECQALPAEQGWGLCKFDHKEGKCVRFQLYELKDGVERRHSGWSAWYGTEYGSPC